MRFAARGFLAVGVLILASIAFQGWRTAGIEAAAQADLRAQLDAGTSSTPTGQTVGVDAKADPSALFEGSAVGEPLAVLRIPSIGVDKVIVDGTDQDSLQQGPGHYQGTAAIGAAGNTAIAGHRSTYGAPFADIDQLEPGDEITIETGGGIHRYRVIGQSTPDGVSGHQIVSPQHVRVLDDYGDNRLTLTACHPKHSDRERIVVQAELIGQPILSEASRGRPSTLDFGAADLLASERLPAATQSD